ncbi:hypothetical protein B484DRAFT_439094, partial [Ochromonadaceae sp. CCMP2298]
YVENTPNANKFFGQIMYDDKNRKKNSGQASPEIMALMGKRVFVYSEGESSDKIELNNSSIKGICGEDAITGRHLYGQQQEFYPYDVINVGGNIVVSTTTTKLKKPSIMDDDFEEEDEDEEKEIIPPKAIDDVEQSELDDLEGNDYFNLSDEDDVDTIE